MDDIAIRVDNVSKAFKLPHERHSSIKGMLISRFRGSHQSYETQQALNGVTFDIKKGEFYGIVGRNGSGKSTLLKMLAGIYTPTEGAITVNGKLTPFIELGVGFSPELSGRENVYLNGALLGFNRKDMDGMYDDIVAFAELERFMDQKLKNYSSGMQVRLAFSIAIRAQTDILLLDEVLAVGDAAFQQKCFNYFEELRQQKKTVVFVSHDMTSVNRFCSRAVYIKNGVLIHEGSPEEVADLYTADNVASMNDVHETRDDLPEEYAVETKISSQTKTELILDVSYRSKTDEPLYVAFSILRDGLDFAQLTTPLDKKLVGKGTVSYRLDITRLNAGVYEMPAILCVQEGRRMVAIARDKNRFVVKGADITRGSALKLPDAWTYSA
jgi:ABC-2 type transport system ATP-binding protein